MQLQVVQTNMVAPGQAIVTATHIFVNPATAHQLRKQAYEMSNNKHEATYNAHEADLNANLERVQKIRKLRRTVISAAIILALFTIGALWANGVQRAEAKAVEECYVNAEANGWDRDLDSIKAICTDSERRKNVMPPAPAE